MAKPVIQRLGTELETIGYSFTSYKELGLNFDKELASSLSAVAAKGTFSAVAAKLTERIEKEKMTIVQEPHALELGRRLVAPVVEAVFASNPNALAAWELYAVNSYEEGGVLGMHQDSVAKTVIIVTASGLRRCDMFGRGVVDSEPGKLERSYNLGPGSVMILDAIADPWHQAKCLKGPSVSAVLDVDAVLRLAA